MYITWKYDLFPYELCGKVTESKGENTYTVEGYGGMQFEATRVIKDDKKGAMIKFMLERATEHYRDDLANLNARHNSYLKIRFLNILGNASYVNNKPINLGASFEKFKSDLKKDKEV